MKKVYFLIALVFTVHSFSQNRYFINSDTRLYTSTNTSGNFLGYFKYGAQVNLLSENKNGWYRIKADNLSEGYVPAKFVATSLNAKDVKTVDKENPILEGGDSYYGGNHLFILAAGLKARTLPDKNSKIKAVLFTGDPVSIDYLPKNEDEWVNIAGTLNEENAMYTLRKFVGKRPDMNTLLQTFDKLDINSIAERKTISERIVELAWNSEKTTLIPAYQRYYEVVKQLNDPKLLAETELNIILAKALSHKKSFEEISAFTKNAEFLLKGTKTKSLYFTQNQLVNVFGNPPKKAIVSDECGLYLSQTFYYYPDLEVSVDEKQNKAEIIKVYLKDNNKFLLNSKATLDKATSEKAFIEKYGTYLDASAKWPHSYTIAMEDSHFTLEFKDGLLFSVEIFFYC